MIDFDVIDINEAIDGLSYEEQLKYLNDTESYIDKESAKLQNLGVEIRNIKEDIFRDLTLSALHNAGYNMELDSNGNLSFTLGLANFTIIMQFLDVKVQFYFNASQSQLLIRELINSILPEFKSDANYYSLQVPEEQICKCVVGVVDKLMKHKEAFLNV